MLNNRLLTGLVALVLLISSVMVWKGQSFTAEAAPLGQAEALPRTITVVGEGRVAAVPDLAEVNVGVESVGATVEEAGAQTEEVMTALIAALEAEGIAADDIQTASYNVYADRPFGVDPAFGGGETTFRFSNNVTIVVRDIDTIEAVLAAAIDAGANNVFGPTFSLSDTAELEVEARRLAVEQAQAKADELAGLNGATVGALISISEDIGNSASYFTTSVSFSSDGYGGAGPISPGQINYTTKIQLTYELQ